MNDEFIVFNDENEEHSPYQESCDFDDDNDDVKETCSVVKESSDSTSDKIRKAIKTNGAKLGRAINYAAGHQVFEDREMNKHFERWDKLEDRKHKLSLDEIRIRSKIRELADKKREIRFERKDLDNDQKKKLIDQIDHNIEHLDTQYDKLIENYSKVSKARSAMTHDHEKFLNIFSPPKGKKSDPVKEYMI